ncbi:MAG: hypothetical protein OXB87_02180, partial [Hyphomicrobiales bacterium]|nr:hypothetical protein [Hyphomicrobiales bacterium]
LRNHLPPDAADSTNGAADDAPADEPSSAAPRDGAADSMADEPPAPAKSDEDEDVNIAYIPPDAADDAQLQAAIQLLQKLAAARERLPEARIAKEPIP